MGGDNPIFNLLKHFHGVFYKVDPNLSSHQQCTKVFFCPCPHKLLLSFVSFNYSFTYLLIFYACVYMYVCVCVRMLDTQRSQNNLWRPVLSLHPVVMGLNQGLAAGASLLSCLSLNFHLFDDRRYSSSYEVVISLQFKFGCLKQLGTDLVTGFNRSVDHLYVFFWEAGGWLYKFFVCYEATLLSCQRIS